MPNSAAKRMIESYLQQKEPGYALLVDAPWGSGKTHIVKQVSNCEADPLRLYVTLYDVDSPTAFDWALVRAINPWSESPTAAWVERTKELVSGIKVLGFSVDVSKVSFIEIALRALPDTLIFDDIERCGLDHTQLSGLINRFVEHQKKRVILIANSNQHREKPAFDATHEKLVGQTITLRPDLDGAMAAFWTKIPDGQGRTILQGRQKLAAKTFEEAGHQNLRLLLRAMRDGAEMLNALNAGMLKFDEAVDNLIATFLALHMAYHGGQLSKEDMLSRGKYRSLPGSKAKKDETAIDALQEVQEAHPDCNIDNLGNWILPVDLGHALIVNGYTSQSNIQERLLSTHQFYAPSEKPDWVRFWNWADEPLEELEEIIERLKKRLKNVEITVPGEILQLYWTSKSIAPHCDIGLNEAGVARYFRKYILRLAQEGKIPARFPSNRRLGDSYGFNDEGGTCSYDGYAFRIDKTDRRVIELMKAQQDKALAQKMPKYASDLVSELSTDFPTFLDRFEYISVGENYSDTPVFQYIKVDEAVEAFLALFVKDRKQGQAVVKLLGERRAQHRQELKDEWVWIDEFKKAAIRKGSDVSPLLGAQIARYFQRFLKAD